jgi:hypothetical protein
LLRAAKLCVALEGGDCAGDDGTLELAITENAALGFATGRGLGRGRADMVGEKQIAWEICLVWPLLPRITIIDPSIMNSSSVIFKKSRSRPGQRAREKSPDGVSQTASERAGSAEESPLALASKLKNKAKRTKPKSTLSFGGDEEVRVFTSYALVGFCLLPKMSDRRWRGLPSEEIKP